MEEIIHPYGQDVAFFWRVDAGYGVPFTTASVDMFSHQRGAGAIFYSATEKGLVVNKIWLPVQSMPLKSSPVGSPNPVEPFQMQQD